MQELLAKYLALYPGETERLRVFQEFLRDTADPGQLVDRRNFAGHITASGFLLSRNGGNLAVVKHKYLNRYLQPGGHVEADDETFVDSAIREINEETGFGLFRQIHAHSDPRLPFDIDTHEIPPNPIKNEPRHLHHDFRYVFIAESEVDPAHCRGETEWLWRPMAVAMEEPSFVFVLSKLLGAGSRAG